jgi:hypothetical protein
MNQKFERYIIQTKYMLDPPNISCSAITAAYDID